MGLGEQERFEVNCFVQQKSVKNVYILLHIIIRTIKVMSKYNIHITLCLLLQISLFYSRFLINSDRTVGLFSILVYLSSHLSTSLYQIFCFLC